MKKKCQRRGSTAVEFAIVCPIVFMLIFGLFEISRAMTVSDAMRTSMIAGAREAGIAETTSQNVVAEMEEVLNLFRVRGRQITVTPAIINDSTTEVNISISIPMDTSNGIVLHRFIGSGDMEMNRVLTR